MKTARKNTSTNGMDLIAFVVRKNIGAIVVACLIALPLLVVGKAVTSSVATVGSAYTTTVR